MQRPQIWQRVESLRVADARVREGGGLADLHLDGLWSEAMCVNVARRPVASEHVTESLGRSKGGGHWSCGRILWLKCSSVSVGIRKVARSQYQLCEMMFSIGSKGPLPSWQKASFILALSFWYRSKTWLLAIPNTAFGVLTTHIEPL